MACSVSWIFPRMNDSSVSQVGVDVTGVVGVFFFTATSPSVAGTRPVVVVSHRKVTSPSAFYPPSDRSSFGYIGGKVRNYLAALDATTGLATGWNPNADFGVY